MDGVSLDGARALHREIARGAAPPERVRGALLDVAPRDRDAWLDVVLGIDHAPDDGPELPRGGVPYLPSPVDALLRAIDRAGVCEEDVFVDVGSGVGRAAFAVHVLTGARVIGIEIQSPLVATARAAAEQLGLASVTFVHGDAVRVAEVAGEGTVFFLYCPFSGERIEALLDDLGHVARRHPVRVCALDVPLPRRAWLRPLAPPFPDTGDLVVCESIVAMPPTAR